MNMYVLHVEGAAGQHDTKQKEKKATRTTQSADLLGVQVSCHCVWFVGCLLYCLAEPPIETKLGLFTGFGRALLGKKKKKKRRKKKDNVEFSERGKERRKRVLIVRSLLLFVWQMGCTTFLF